MLADLIVKAKEFWSIYKRSKFGVAGLILLIMLSSGALYAVLVFPYGFFTSQWISGAQGDYGIWYENPRLVPPCWAVGGEKYDKLRYDTVMVNKSVLQEQEFPIPGLNETLVFKFYMLNYTIRIPYNYDYILPTDVRIMLDVQENITVHTERAQELAQTIGIDLSALTPYGSIFLIRPDGAKVDLLTKLESLYYEYEINGEKHKVSLPIQDVDEIKKNIKTFIFDYYLSKFGKNLNITIEIDVGRFLMADFTEDLPQRIYNNSVKVLKGDYEFVVQVMLPTVYVKGEEELEVKEVVNDYYVLLLGNCYGILGTDFRRRDVSTGILIGLPWSFIIGGTLALVTVMVGTLYGVTAAYLGGFKEEFMMRVVDTMNSIPVLPIIIAVATVLSMQRIRTYITVWELMALLMVFYWTSPVITVRSMALQIKEMPFIEAAKAIGAKGVRIVTRHIMPQVLPYSFAIMTLSVPTGILIEAGLSILGISDKSTPTWGRMLEEAYNEQAFTQWWWFIPPGLMIALVSMAFILVGRALEWIYNPRLRRL